MSDDFAEELIKSGIWGEPVTEEYGSSYFVHSQRLGVSYIITQEAAYSLRKDYAGQHPDIQLKLTTWVIDQYLLGDPRPKINFEILRDVNTREKLSVMARAERILLYAKRIQKNISDKLKVSALEENLHLLSWSESSCISDVFYLLNYLVKINLIEEKNGFAAVSVFEITPEGYNYLDNLSKKKIDSEQAFVAMWFDSSMDNVYARAINPAIQDAGYMPLRIDKTDHNNKIDDQIIAEIKRSRFLIADFTHGNEGMRGGVYYEAGLAHGLGLPVIFTCRKDLIENIHFDTRQYNHILWDSDEEGLSAFRRALSNRISATIGDGPQKK